MNGADFLIKLRMHGRRPSCVFLADYPARPAIANWTIEQQIRQRALPTFHVEQLHPAAQDLRFLVGIPVHLHADDMSRAVAWVDRLLQDGAGPIYQLTEQELTIWQPC